MLRSFRASDIAGYMHLYRAHFPEEAAVLLTDPAGFQRTLERAFSPPARFVLATLRLFGRPLLDFLALEEGGALAGAAFVFYPDHMGYISSVVVDTPFRRRGFARAIMAEAERRIRARHRPYAVLDVISTNSAARQLYESIGYREIRRIGWFALDLPGGTGSLPASAGSALGGRVRRFRRSDGRPLAELARARQPADDRSIRPVEAEAFRVPPVLARIFGSRSEAFVLDGGGPPQGFARATSAGVMASGHLVPPIVAPGLGDQPAEALFDAALAFFREHPAPRIIAEAPLDDPAMVRQLESRGFRRALTMETLAKPMNA